MVLGEMIKNEECFGCLRPQNVIGCIRSGYEIIFTTELNIFWWKAELSTRIPRRSIRMLSQIIITLTPEVNQSQDVLFELTFGNMCRQVVSQ